MLKATDFYLQKQKKIILKKKIFVKPLSISKKALFTDTIFRKVLIYLASIHFTICTLRTPLTDVRTNVKSFHKIDLKFVRVFVTAVLEMQIFK